MAGAPVLGDAGGAVDLGWSRLERPRGANVGRTPHASVHAPRQQRRGVAHVHRKRPRAPAHVVRAALGPDQGLGASCAVQLAPARPPSNRQPSREVCLSPENVTRDRIRARVAQHREFHLGLSVGVVLGAERRRNLSPRRGPDGTRANPRRRGQERQQPYESQENRAVPEASADVVSGHGAADRGCQENWCSCL